MGQWMLEIAAIARSRRLRCNGCGCVGGGARDAERGGCAGFIASAAKEELPAIRGTSGVLAKAQHKSSPNQCRWLRYGDQPGASCHRNCGEVVRWESGTEAAEVVPRPTAFAPFSE